MWIFFTSVDGFRAVVERHLEVEVTGLDRSGRPIKIDAAGWQARILQHECDHLDGTIFVDKMVPRTFRTVENLDLPLPMGCPKLGVQWIIFYMTCGTGITLSSKEVVNCVPFKLAKMNSVIGHGNIKLRCKSCLIKWSATWEWIKKVLIFV